MEENNTTEETPDAPPPPEVAAVDAPPPVPVEVASPVETEPVATVEEIAPVEEKESQRPFSERLGAPAARLRTLQGGPVVALAVATFVLFVVSVLLALMVFAPGIAPVRLGSSKAGYAAQRDLAIERVAVRFARNFMTFDYRTLDANLTQMSKDATGNFSKQLVALRKEKTVMQTLIAQKATSRGSIQGQTVESVHGDTASVRVFLNQMVTNKSHAQPSQTFRVLDFTLVRTPQGWKVDNVG